MAFNRDTPQVKEWMADYFDGKISEDTAARLDVGGTGGEFGTITEEDCKIQSTYRALEEIYQNTLEIQKFKPKELNKVPSFNIPWPVGGTGIRAFLQSNDAPDCIVAAIDPNATYDQDDEIETSCPA